MVSKKALERHLADLSGFDEPKVELEQYPTPADVAAQLLHFADLHGDLDRTVVDLGAGTGILAIGAALQMAPRVIGLDRDRRALSVARRNERRVDLVGTVDWIHGDATDPPLALTGGTVLMNPPFGAQRGHRHADRDFLQTAAAIAGVSYSIHNADSHAFVRAFAADHGGTVTHAFKATLTIDHQFPFHSLDQANLPVEVFRIEWA